MAQHEEDREDLLAEAVALVERIELSLPGQSESVVVGFRRDGSLSAYFGASPVYQFNHFGKLRRGYRDGLLYKADRGRLFSMRRERGPSQVTLWRTELSQQATAEFLAEAMAALRALHDAIASGGVNVVGQHPENGDVSTKVERWLAEHKLIEVADAPGLR